MILLHGTFLLDDSEHQQCGPFTNAHGCVLWVCPVWGAGAEEGNVGKENPAGFPPPPWSQDWSCTMLHLPVWPGHFYCRGYEVEMAKAYDLELD